MRRIFIIAAMTLTSLAAPLCHALGFGEIQLRSALNQPLQAEIPLLAVKPAERDQVSVDIATTETFQRFGVERPAILDQIDVQIMPGALQTQLRVILESRVPIQEPFLTFLLEANWPDGRAIREYTVLLDPPVSPPRVSAAPAPIPPPLPAPEPTVESAASPSPPAPAAPIQPSQPLPAPAAAPVTAPPPVAQISEPTPSNTPRASVAQSGNQSPVQSSAAPQAVVETTPPLPERATTPEVPVRAEPGKPGSQYGPVAAKETLWSIAGKTIPADGITQNQMMLAIYQANPEAFDGNINLMRKGVVLEIPSENEIRGINVLAAKAEIDDQESSFEASRRAAAKQAAATAAKTETATLKLEPATVEAPAESGQAETRAEATALPEQQATAEPQEDEPAPVAASSGQTAGLEQAPADSGTVEPEAVGSAAVSENAEQSADDTADSPAENEYSQAVNSINGRDNAGNLAEAESDEKTSQASDSAAEAAVTGDAIPEPAASEETDLPEQITSATQTATEKAEAAYESAADGLSDIQQAVVPENLGPLITPRLLLIGLAVILLIVGLLIMWNRRRYKAVPADFLLEETEDSDSGLSVPPAGAAVMAAATAGNTEAAGQQVDVDEVLMDADSHIAHELYDEALAVLDVGLAAHPGNPALQYKVLEVHHAAGDSAAFMARVDDYFATASPDDPEWDLVAAMGRDLVPDDPRFQVDEQPASPAAMIDDAPGLVDNAAQEPAATLDTGDSDMDFLDNNADTVEEPADQADEIHSGSEDIDKQQSEDSGYAGAALAAGTFAASASTDNDSPQDLAASIDEVPPQEADDVTVLDLDDSLDFDLSDFDAPAAASGSGMKAQEQAESALDIDELSSDIGSEVASDDRVDEGLDFDISEMDLSDDDSPGKQNIDAAESEPAVTSASLADSSETKPEWPGASSDETQTAATADDFQLGQDTAQDDLQLNVDDDAEPASELSIEDITADGVAPVPADSGTDAPTAVDEEEVTTKLDLARAYIDMGEADMAESLLQEVQSQGNAAQRSEAQELLGRQS